MDYLCKLIIIFIIYSFIGWLTEVIFTLFVEKRFINRGFLIGPICPIYGFGGVLILIFLTRYKNDPIILYTMSVMIAAILEYFTSYIMEKIFKNRWWDYSDMKYNINGRICLETLIPFGILALFATYIVNPILLNIISMMNNTILYILTIIIVIIGVIDVVLSFNVIIKLKNISNSIRSDSTEAITKKVKEIILDENFLLRRLVNSFPNIQIFNTMSILTEKLKLDKEKLKKEKKRLRKRK